MPLFEFKPLWGLIVFFIKILYNIYRKKKEVDKNAQATRVYC